MKVLRVLLYGMVLTIVDLACIIVAFGVYTLLRPANQIAVQAPIAALLTIAVFLAWSLLLPRSPLRGLSLQGWGEWAGAFLASLLWAPLIFVPLHFLTQGYLTSFGNITATWLFQVPVNAVAILLVSKVTRNGLRLKPTTSISTHLKAYDD